MKEVKAMEEPREEKCRVVVVLTEKEKRGLRILAWRDGRSMSNYFRQLLINDVTSHYDIEI